MTVETAKLRPGYEISRVIKGGWQLAGGHGAFDRAEAVSDMTAFFDAGIRTFDCADIYTGVEEMIGDFIAGLRKDRGTEEAGKVQVHTKLVPDLQRLETYTPADAEAIIDRSLRRLGIEQLHLVQIYWWDLRLGRPVEVMASLKQLQEKGKIGYLGATNWDSGDMTPFIQAGLDLMSAQVQYSLLDFRPAGRFSDWCRDHDIQLLNYGTLAGGFLTEVWRGKADPGFEFKNRSLTKYRLVIEEFGGWDLFQALLDVLAAIAGKHGVATGSVASRFMLDQPQVAAVIIGARTARNLARTLEVFDLALDDADCAAIGEIIDRRAGPEGPVYGLERDRTGRHGRIMKYNLNTASA